VLIEGGGLPLATLVDGANQAETTLVEQMYRRLPWWLRALQGVNLLGDGAYDSDPLRRFFQNQGWVLLSPHRRGRIYWSNDGRRMRRYARRWIVERTISWLHHYRRLVTRWEFYPDLFHGFVQLACAIICVSRL
jgi:transposase